MKLTEEFYEDKFCRQNVDDSIEFLCKIVGFEQSEAMNLLKDYFNELDKGFCDLTSAIEVKDYYGLSRIAHGLKGSAGTSNLKELEILARKLELSALDENLDECENYVDILNNYVNNMKYYLEKQLNNSII